MGDRNAVTAMAAGQARADLAAALRQAAPGITGDDMMAVLAAADSYRDAEPDRDGRVVHLRGPAGWHSACRRRWQDPDRLRLTGNPALVNCPRCRGSLRYRSLTDPGTRPPRLTFPQYQPGAADILLEVGKAVGFCLDEGGGSHGYPKRWRAYLFPAPIDKGTPRPAGCEEATARTLKELRRVLRERVELKGGWWC